MDIHIGEMVRRELKHQERTIAWLARKLECSRSNIYDIFYRKDIDLFLLIRISKVLQHNFLKDLMPLLDEPESTPETT
ncbi:MAG: XRE family transcriptional regulator [Bacteroides sp.]|nr:XRE family transcriptional regulator [Bacteroides sp.]